MSLIPLNDEAKKYLEVWRQVNNLHRSVGFYGEKFNHSGDYGEAILRSVWSGIKKQKGHSDAVDLVLMDGRTVQVKTVSEIHTEVSCTYSGDETVDLIAILEPNNTYTEVRLLYFGPFKEFIEEVNKNTRVMGWDNKRRPSKELIKSLQLKYGLPEFHPPEPFIYQFCE